MNPLDNWLFSNIGLWGYGVIIIAASVIVSATSEVANRLTPEKYHISVILLVISFFVCLGLIFLFPSYYMHFDIAFTAFMLFINVIVSFLFSPSAGKAILNRIMKKAEDKANDIIDKV
ncbi:MAG: hypothetical protein WC974_09175 [Thermoplasmata archaeon]